MLGQVVRDAGTVGEDLQRCDHLRAKPLCTQRTGEHAILQSMNRQPGNRQPVNRHPVNRQPANRQPLNRQPVNKQTLLLPLPRLLRVLLLLLLLLLLPLALLLLLLLLLLPLLLPKQKDSGSMTPPCLATLICLPPHKHVATVSLPKEETVGFHQTRNCKRPTDRLQVYVHQEYFSVLSLRKA